MRHGPSWSRATRDDGNVYRFEAVETCGALWDSVLLKRKYFHECEPNTTWKEEVVNKNKEGEDEEETDDDDVVEEGAARAAAVVHEEEDDAWMNGWMHA